MASKMSLKTAVLQELTDKFPWRFIFIAFGISWTCWFFVALTGRNIFSDLEVGIVAVPGSFVPTITASFMPSPCRAEK